MKMWKWAVAGVVMVGCGGSPESKVEGATQDTHPPTTSSQDDAGTSPGDSGEPANQNDSGDIVGEKDAGQDAPDPCPDTETVCARDQRSCGDAKCGGKTFHCGTCSAPLACGADGLARECGALCQITQHNCGDRMDAFVKEDAKGQVWCPTNPDRSKYMMCMEDTAYKADHPNEPLYLCCYKDPR